MEKIINKISCHSRQWHEFIKAAKAFKKGHFDMIISEFCSENFGHVLFGREGIISQLMPHQEIIITTGDYVDVNNRKVIYRGFASNVPSSIYHYFALDDNGARINGDHLEFFGVLTAPEF